MIFRSWREGDEKDISAIEKTCFSSPWTESMFVGAAKSEGFIGYVAENDGEIVGYIAALFNGFDGEIADLAVSPLYRGQGAGKALLNAAISQMETLGADKVFLEVRVSNAPARSLYDSFGFAPLYVRKKYYENTEDAIVMVKSLKK